jgi:acyl-CoA reductase-like NAD-dependent aldehyde dehydrogenase
MTINSVPLELTDEVTHALDADVAALTAGIARWAETPLTQRARLMTQVHDSVAAHAAAWVAAAVAAKRTPPELAGEEWFSGPYVTMDGFAGVAQSLERLATGRSPIEGLSTGSAPGGRATIEVLPTTAYERVLLSGFSAEVWLEPGVGLDQAEREAGLGARETGVDGGVGVVLGAGNVAGIGPLDVLYELIAFNRASVLKLNPTFASLKPVYERALAPLIEADLLRIVNGAAAVGGYLTGHPGIEHVHITGSAITHDAIVWGVGEEAAERRAAGEPKLTKAITSELGGVSPIIVIPGTWSDADLRYQAEHVVTQRLHNSGHNCIAGQTLVLSADWPQREAFLAALREVLDSLPARGPWYPGSDAKIALAKASYPDAERHADNRLLIQVDDTTSQDLFTTEYFTSVLGHTSLPGRGADFFARAVEFANTRLDGTLGASIIVAPGDRKAMGGAFDATLAELRYGTIAINAWSAMGFLLRGAPWGAYPGNTLEAAGSGIGVVHNSYLLPHTERTVVTGPFRPFPRSVLHGELSLSPKAPWFLTAKTGATTAERMTGFVAKPGWARIPAIVASAVRG